jgi:1-acyl-sn-glycerol-3-phosphate acyltransferase
MRAFIGAIIIILYLTITNLFSGRNSIYSKSGSIDWLLSKSLDLKIISSTGPPILPGRNLILANHPGFLDGFYLAKWAISQNVLHRIKFIVAEWVTNIPLPGFNKDHFIKVKRDWTSDKETLSKAICQLPEDAIVFIFPEGTTFCPGSLEKTVDYARKHHLPVYKYLMYPRYKGLELMLQVGKWGALYDMTLHYSARLDNPFSGSDFEYLLWGNYPRTCSIEWHKIKEIPTKHIDTWLQHLWTIKDRKIAMKLKQEIKSI